MRARDAGLRAEAAERAGRARRGDLLIDEIAADCTRDREALERSVWGSERRAEDNMSVGRRVRCPTSNVGVKRQRSTRSELGYIRPRPAQARALTRLAGGTGPGPRTHPPPDHSPRGTPNDAKGLRNVRNIGSFLGKFVAHHVCRSRCATRPPHRHTLASRRSPKFRLQPFPLNPLVASA